MINKVKTFLEQEALLSIPLLLLASLVLALFITGAGFFVGKVCSPLTLRVIWAAEIAIVTMLSWKQGLKLICTLVIIAVATMFTFSYVGTDALAYHFPMQDLLINGWNPVFDSSLERFDKVVGGLGLSRYHTLFLPKVNALCGALVALALNIYTGDAFLNYALMVSFLAVAYRFAKDQWYLNSFYSAGFAMVCVFSTKVTSFLAGQVDYVAYAGLCIAILSAVLWIKNSKLRDLGMLILTLLVCMLSKSTGLVCGVLIAIIALAFAWRRQSFWISMFVLGVLVVTIGASPLLTAWIQYGSPVYPNMTFDPSISPVDITSDFVSNADGDRMGYFARIAYAWISPSITEKVCSLIYGKPDFHPEFYVCGGVKGLGAWFNALLFLSIAAFALSKKSWPLGMAIFVFVTSNLAPLKYIGYNRYFPQMWIIPALAFFNLYAHPCEIVKDRLCHLVNYVVKGLLLVLLLLSILSMMRIFAYQCRMAAIENIRRDALVEMSKESSVWNLPAKEFLGYSITRRALQAGIMVEDNVDAPRVNADYQFLVLSKAPMREVIDSVSQKYPLCDSPTALVRFPWCSGIKQILKLSPLYR